jgi:acyl-CoA hydrolase
MSISPVPFTAVISWRVAAQLVLTGRSSMHIQVTVRAAPVATGLATQTTTCVVIFVAVDDRGRPTPVPAWEPVTSEQRRAAEDAVGRIGVRQSIEQAMATQTYSDEGTAPTALLRFLAAPTDVNWGGKTHGGTVMRWIDEAAWVCAVGWSGMECLPAFSGGIRFYRSIPIGNLVLLSARLLHTGRSSMHISVHVSSADPRVGEFELNTHCLTVFVALADGRPVPTKAWRPTAEEDRRLDAHAVHLMKLRAG